MLADKTMNEAALRDAKVPCFKTKKELMEYINSLVEREHDYGTCVYAMSMASVATFNYVAGKLGVTGFQASCADLDIIKRIRLIEGGFMLSKLQDALYPQYDLRKNLENWLNSKESKKWLREQAALNLKTNKDAHNVVIDHWKKLAK